MSSNKNAVAKEIQTCFCLNRPFYHFSQIPLFSFCLHLLNFHLTIHFGHWSNEYQLIICMSRERWQISKEQPSRTLRWAAYLLLHLFAIFLWSIKSFHRGVRKGDLQHICVCYVITDAFLWYKMEMLENKEQTVGLAVRFLFSFFCKPLLGSKSTNQLSTCFTLFITWAFTWFVIKLCSNFVSIHPYFKH